MKSNFYLLFSIFLLLGSVPTFAQIGIGTKTPAPSAALEVTSSTNNKGILIPRITATQKDAIVSPAEGLLVYQTTAPIGFYYYSNTVWKLIVDQTDLDNKLATAKTYVDDKIAAATIADADANAKGKIQLAGDLGGTAAAPTVPGLALKANSADLATVATSGNYNDLVNKPSAYVIPKASASELGGVKVGANLSIDANGVLSAAASNSITGVVPVANGGTGTNSVPGILSALGFASNNVAIGSVAGTPNQGVNANTIAIGGGAGRKNQGAASVAIGYVSGDQNQGFASVAIGSNAAQSGQGTQAVALGFAAGQNGQGAYSVAVGSFAGNSQAANSIALNATGASLNPGTTGFFVAPVRNTTATSTALYYNTTTKEITSGTAASGGVPYTGATSAVNLGNYDLTVNGITAGMGSGNLGFNTVFGRGALSSTALTNGGNYNLATGYVALQSNTTGSFNTATGTYSLLKNTTGINNTGYGVSSLFKNTTGNNNTAIGYEADVATAALTNATAIGAGAIVAADNTIQLGNTAVTNVNTSGELTVNGIKFGRGAGNVSTNTAAGSGALSSNTTGATNTAVGFKTLNKNTNGEHNTAIGNEVLSQNSSGRQNAGLGNSALKNNTSGVFNTAMGTAGLESNATGSHNTATGFQALDKNVSGDNNTAIGSGADVATDNLSNTTAIGYQASVSVSNTIQLGNTDVTNVKTSGTVTAGAVTYPNAHGTSGQVLSTTGSGTLAWTTPSASSTHYVGEPYGGGIVFYVWDNGVHGLIVAPHEIGVEGPQNFSPTTGIKWGPANDTGAYRFGIGGGLHNTDVILAKNVISGQQYFDYAQTTSNLYAAFIAQQYSAYTQGNVPPSSFGDWYLPSMGELKLLYTSLGLISGSGYNSSHVYWSSTEVNNNYVYQLSVGGGQNWNTKSTLSYVLPIRKF